VASLLHRSGTNELNGTKDRGVRRKQREEKECKKEKKKPHIHTNWGNLFLRS
jgi:hypothetical protein